MMPIDLSHPAYHDPEEARKLLEAIRWPNGAVCSHCGSVEKIRPLVGKSMGAGWYYCGECQDKFTVRMGTVYERSKIPLHKWLMGFRLMAASKKGISAHQLHRTLNITYKSAWFMAHRIREAMRDTDPSPLGGKDVVVEADETFIGKPELRLISKGWKYKTGVASKRKVISLVERGGKVRSFKVKDLNIETIRDTLQSNIKPETTLHTDEAQHYKRVGKEFAAHERVNHSEGEYARGDVTTNTVEGFFSIFKRGMTGIYQHCGEQHLQRYLHEFDFRYSNRAALEIDDAQRTALAIKGAEGKRLKYRNPNFRKAA